jgi:hypothetical protein
MSLRLPGESMLSRSAYAAPTKSPYEVDGAKTWLWHGAFFFWMGTTKTKQTKWPRNLYDFTYLTYKLNMVVYIDLAYIEHMSQSNIYLSTP